MLLKISNNLHETSRNLQKKKKNVLDCMYSPFTKIAYILAFPSVPLERISELSLMLSPWLLSSFCPKWNLTHNSHFAHLFKLAVWGRSVWLKGRYRVKEMKVDIKCKLQSSYTSTVILSLHSNISLSWQDLLNYVIFTTVILGPE